MLQLSFELVFEFYDVLVRTALCIVDLVTKISSSVFIQNVCRLILEMLTLFDRR